MPEHKRMFVKEFYRVFHEDSIECVAILQTVPVEYAENGLKSSSHYEMRVTYSDDYEPVKFLEQAYLHQTPLTMETE